MKQGSTAFSWQHGSHRPTWSLGKELASDCTTWRYLVFLSIAHQEPCGISRAVITLFLFKTPHTESFNSGSITAVALIYPTFGSCLEDRSQQDGSAYRCGIKPRAPEATARLRQGPPSRDAAGSARGAAAHCASTAELAASAQSRSAPSNSLGSYLD